MDENYIVYAKLDAAGRITALNSSAFLTDTDGWTAIDEGAGDKYHHAQGNYLDGPVRDMDGIPLYKWDGTQVTHRTEEEIEADRAAIPAPPPGPMEVLRADIDFVAAIGGIEL